ncbi:MAG: sulfatase-like hydrolase/transferase [Verrucomicrobiales bacterium]|nr:sulfatase-like hydrolase/transferase [Verrucomicrobiales bacterium]
MRLFSSTLLTVLLLSLATATGATEPRPNILWITAEDMSADLGCYGDRYATTPHIDRLATRSIRYTRAYAESPMCAPSRCALITGMHTGPLGTSPMRSNHPVPAGVRGFPALLREAGYHCTNNVKTDYNVADEPAMIRDAWDESSATAHWRGRPAGKPFFCVLNYMDTHQSRSSRDDHADFVGKVQSRLTAAEIHDPAAAPLPPYYPDTPTARRTVARYYDCITTLDHFVRDTLADLEADGLAQDTIVFFFSDHGAGLPGGKAAAYRRGLHVPLLVHVPEKFRHLAPAANGTVSDRLVSFVDFAPTVLSLAGVALPGHLHGRPFLGPAIPEPPTHVHGTRDRMDETLEVTRWLSDGRYHLVRSFDPRPPADQQTLLSCYNSHGELCREIRSLKAAGQLTEAQTRLWGDHRPPVQLFDTETDPWCQHDLADDPAHADRLTHLLGELERIMLANRDLGLWPEPERVEAGPGADYPQERVLAVANGIGRAGISRDPFLKALADPHPAVRYWAIVGLSTLGNEAGDDNAAFQTALDDSAASVRIAAAETLVRRGETASTGRALDLLTRELDSRNEYAASRAARSLELLGESARPALEAMRDTLKRRSSGFFLEKGPDATHYALEFSLMMAVRALDDAKPADKSLR